MKKRIAGLAALLLGMGLMAGCGAGAETETSANLHRMQVDKYVTPGDYANISVSVAAPEVSQEQWDELTLAVYQSYGGITDRAVEEGDTVDIDYEGRLDGVPFANGTDTGALLTIGSDEFIDGFEDGLIGVMPGETVELELTFPENFRSEEMAGKEVAFTVTVNCILPEWEDMQDSVIAAQELDEVTTADGFANQYYRMGSEDYINVYSEVQARQEVLLQAIANREGLGVDDEELKELLEEYAGYLEYDSVEKLLEDFDREECRNYFMAEKVMDYLMENADITE